MNCNLARSKKILRTTFSLFTALLLVGFLVACDSSTVSPDPDPGDEFDTTIDGRATDGSGYTSNSSSDQGAHMASSTHRAGVSAATVTAASVSADGTTTSLQGEAETNAEGEYSLELEGASSVMILSAEADGYSSSALVHATGEASVDAMPMTTESNVESEVYVEAKNNDDEDLVTVADVAVHVDQDLAVEIEGDASSQNDVALSIRDGVYAEDEAREQDDEGADRDEILSARLDAFAQLQSDLAASTSAEADQQAIIDFEERLADLHVEVGASVEAQARARQSNSRATVNMASNVDISSDARVALQRRAEVLTALATSHAIIATMEAEGASSSSVDAIAEARNELVAELRTATSLDAIASAKSSFESEVQSELAAELNVDDAIFSLIVDFYEDTTTSLQASLSGASPNQVASIYADFYSETTAEIESELSGAGNAEMGARVLVLLSAMMSVS